jgi:TetR/AcrR family transcriptional regulator
MTDDQITTKQKILHAALKVFVAKGKDGARMQEIADMAGVNKAMLFYYYTSKDLLYAEVFRTNMMQIFGNLKQIMISADETESKIEQIVNAYISFFNEHPDLPKLMLRELASNGDTVKQAIREIKQHVGDELPNKFISLVNAGISESQYYELDPKQTIISIVGMCLIYFIGRPIIDVLLELDDMDPDQFIQQRKQNIMLLLKHGLLRK